MDATPQQPLLRDTVGRSTPANPVDVAVGASTLAAGAAAALVRTVRPFVAPLAGVVLSPPLLPSSLRPGRWLDTIGRRGAAQVAGFRQEATQLLDVLVPVVAKGLVQRADLTTILTRYVDINVLAAQVDLDAAASHLDIDAVAKRLDVEAVLDRIDLTELALKRIDLDVLVEAVLNHVDLTDVVLERVDLDALVNAVLERVDLVGLADEVIDGVDLPGIIRESTGSMASDTVLGARMQGIAADEAVSRMRSRLFFRRGQRPPPEPGPQPAPSAPATAGEVPAQPGPSPTS